MKALFLVLLTAAGISSAHAQAPAGAPAGTTATCNDGSYTSAASKRGACSGHKGVKDWYASSAPAPAAPPAAKAGAPVPPTSPATTPAPVMTPAQVTTPAPAKTASATPAAGGGNGQVWVNTATNVYHCQGDRWYGKTKAGSYMTEAAAKQAGAHADHAKACS